MHRSWWTLATFLALAVVSMLVPSSEGAEPGPMVEKPDELGPYTMGYFDGTIQTSTKSYAHSLRYYYPANGSGGWHAEPDPSGAPHMTIVWLPPYGGTYDILDFQARHLVSYGAVVVTFGINWSDFGRSGNPQDMEDLLDHLEALNTTAGGRLHGMVDGGAFGVCGHSSGGGYSLYDGAYVDRFRAVQAWGAAIGHGTVDTIAQVYDKPVMLQVGQDDGGYISNSRRAYAKFPRPKSLLELIGGAHHGPFNYHAYVSFYLYHLAGRAEYGTFLYGDGALQDVADGTSDTRFEVDDDLFFPPDLTPSVSTTSTPMDEPVDFMLAWRGYMGRDLAALVHEWDVDDDRLPDAIGTDGPNVTFAFTAPGTYPVAYRYHLGAFNKSSDPVTMTVSNVLPTALAGPDVEVDHDGELTLNASASNDTPSDRDALLYKWEFSDGHATNLTSHPTVTRWFHEVAVVWALLTVLDPHGGVGSDVVNITVVNVPPVADSGWNLTSEEDSTVTFMGEGEDTRSHRDDLSFRWEFGDGTGSGWSPDPRAYHSYPTSGDYTVTLTVRDPQGATGRGQGRVRIENVGPEAGIVHPSDGTELAKDQGLDLRATATDTPSDIDLLEYRWDFGDGNATGWSDWRGSRTTHRYTVGGRYTITLQVVDDDGSEDVATVQVTVVNAPPTAEILTPWPSAEVDEDVRLTFYGTGSDTPSDMAGLTYHWLIDGDVYVHPRFSHSFEEAGIHVAEFFVTDREGAVNSSTVTVTVNNVAPQVQADIEPLELQVDRSLTFSATAFDTPSDMITVMYLWDFGEGSTTYRPNGTHVYSAPGNYTVTLTVRDDDGEEASSTWRVRVSEPPQGPPVGPPPEDGDGDEDDDASSITLGLIGLVVVVTATLIVLFLRGSMSLGAGSDGHHDVEGRTEEGAVADAEEEGEEV